MRESGRKENREKDVTILSSARVALTAHNTAGKVKCTVTFTSLLHRAGVLTIGSVLHASSTHLFLPRDAMHKRGLCRHAVSVCVFVTFVSCVKTNKNIFETFSPSGSQAILVFPCQTGWRYSDGNLPCKGGGVECRWSRQKTRFWTNIVFMHTTVTLVCIKSGTLR